MLSFSPPRGAEAAKVQSWLDELINYAEPSVRSSVATNIRYDEQATDWAKGLAEKHANNGSEEALVQQSRKHLERNGGCWRSLISCSQGVFGAEFSDTKRPVHPYIQFKTPTGSPKSS